MWNTILFPFAMLNLAIGATDSSAEYVGAKYP